MYEILSSYESINYDMRSFHIYIFPVNLSIIRFRFRYIIKHTHQPYKLTKH